MKLNSYLRDVKGNLAITMSLAMVPLLLGAGAAIDFSRASRTQTVLQEAVDAAVVAGGASELKDTDKIEKAVKDYLIANGADSAVAEMVSIESGSDKKTGHFYVRMTGRVDTTFMALAGIPKMDIGAYSEIVRGSTGVEVALVLDNTASMNSDGRLVALKDSAKKMIATLKSSIASDAYMKISVIPFSNYVNVGVANRNQSWMSVPADWTDAVDSCYDTFPKAVYSNCHTVKDPYMNDGVPAFWTHDVCDVNPGPAVKVCYKPTHAWNGCAGSRKNPLDVTIGSMASSYPGIMDVSCGSELLPLTDDVSALNTKIDNLVATGETYIPSGLVWGWNALDSNQPLMGAKTDADMKALGGSKVMVLMTDGDNTISADYTSGQHYSVKGNPDDDGAVANVVTAQLCDNIKAAGITIYTVGFKVTKPSSVDLLANCASNANQAYNAADSAALVTAFGDIASSIAQIRIVK